MLVVGVDDVVGADSVRRLADEVGIEEDGQAHAAGTDVSDAERHLAGQSLLDAEVHLVRERWNEVGIEAVEALRTELGGAVDAGRIAADPEARAAGQGRAGGQERHIGILAGWLLSAGHGGAGAGRSTHGLSAAVVVVVDLDDAIFHAHGVVGAALVETGEQAVAAADDSAGVRRPARSPHGAERGW